jgi:hypothetical protein
MTGDALSGPDGTQPPETAPGRPEVLGTEALLPPVETFGAPAGAGAEDFDPPTMPVSAAVLAEAGRQGSPAPRTPRPARPARGAAVPGEVAGGSRPTTHESPRRRRVRTGGVILLVLFLLVLAYNLIRLLYTTFH